MTSLSEAPEGKSSAHEYSQHVDSALILAPSAEHIYFNSFST